MKHFVAILSLFLLLGFSAQAQRSDDLNTTQRAKLVSKVYPNPASSFINFSFKSMPQSGYTLQIFSFLGRRMSNILITSSTLQVNLSQYFPGIYVYQLRDAEGRVIDTNKFQVVR